MFKVLLNNFLHTTLSSSSQNELDFMIFHILLILHIFSKGIGLYDFAHFESQTEKCLHSGPAVCIGCVFEHSLFSKALWTLFQSCCIYVLQFNQVLCISICYPAIWQFGNLSLPLLFGLRHLIAIVFAALITIKIASFFTVEMTTSSFCICHTFDLFKYVST